MSKTIYSTQEKLNSIFDIYTCYETPDKELFDTSDYPNGGKGRSFMEGKKHTKETKILMSNAHLGIGKSEETKKKMSEAKKGMSSHWKGKKQTEDHKKKRSIAIKESWRRRKLGIKV